MKQSRKKEKRQIALQNPELELCENGDFKIKADLVNKYEIIDMHCHLFRGLSQLFPRFLQREMRDNMVSLMDKSCFPFSMGLFDLDKICFSGCPVKLLSLDGIRTRVKLFSGVFVLPYATEKRLMADMDRNNIRKAVVLQINPPSKSCGEAMDDMVKNNNRLYTFGSIHPYDRDIPAKIDRYMNWILRAGN